MRERAELPLHPLLTKVTAPERACSCLPAFQITSGALSFRRKPGVTTVVFRVSWFPGFLLLLICRLQLTKTAWSYLAPITADRLRNRRRSFADGFIRIFARGALQRD
jgi:hypothetical protein